MGSPGWCGGLGANKGCGDYGRNGVEHMSWFRLGYSAKVSKLDAAGMDILALWANDALMFKVNGEDHGEAFRVGDQAEHLPAEGDLYPFLTTYGPGTTVCLESPCER